MRMGEEQGAAPPHLRRMELEGRTDEMHRELLGSVDEMLAPDLLSCLLEAPITDVRSTPFKTVDALSGGSFLAIDTNEGRGPRLVLKRFSYESDWIMRATDDHRGRAALVWQTGLLDRLPQEIFHGYLACARDGTGWAILMHDLSTFLVPSSERPISAGENERLLEAMAALHGSFWDEPQVVDPALGFSRLEADYTFLTPQTGRREAGGSDPVPRLLPEGWDVLLATVEPAIADALVRLAQDPSPLCDALRAFPQTVVHADWKLGNLGLIDGARPRAILLDWARVLAAPAIVDLAWYLAVNNVRIPVSKEATIDCYRQSLERQLGGTIEERAWQAQLELSLLGSFLQLGWSKALGAVRGSSEEVRRREGAELAWWSESILPAIERL